MDEAVRLRRDVEARELEVKFKRIAESARAPDPQLKALAAAAKGRRGWSYPSLWRKWGCYRARGFVERAYRGSEAETVRKPLDWRGWRPAELAAVLRMAGLTQGEWARRHGENGAAVSYALGEKKRSLGAQRVADKLARWALKFLRRRLAAVEEAAKSKGKGKG